MWKNKNSEISCTEVHEFEEKLKFHVHGFEEITKYHLPRYMDLKKKQNSMYQVPGTGYMNLKKNILMCSSGGGGGPAQKKKNFFGIL